MPSENHDVRRALDQPEQELRPNSQIDSFLLLEQIGRGSYGDVWRVHDARTETTAAVKFFRRGNFPPETQYDAAIRFWEGAAAMRKLAKSDYIVRLFDGPKSSRGHLYYSMEYVPRRDLSLVLKHGTISDEQRFQFVDDIIEALRAAHKQNIVHRDVRPRNILLRDGDDRVRAILTDFDIAYFEHALRSRKSTNSLVGIMRYIPPEVPRAGLDQLQKEIRNPKNDLYALAIVVLDIFAGLGETVPSDKKAAEKLIRGHCKALPRFQTKRLAEFCIRGAHPTDKRFGSITDLATNWGAIRLASPMAGFIAIIIGFLAAANVGIFADWMWYKFYDQLWLKVVLGLLALIPASATVLGGIGVSALVQEQMPFMWRWLLGRLPETRTLFVVVSVLVILLPAIAFATGLPERAGTVSIEADPGCKLVCRTSDDQLSCEGAWHVDDIDKIVCAKDHSAYIRPHSLLTPTVKVRALPPVSSVSSKPTKDKLPPAKASALVSQEAAPIACTESSVPVCGGTCPEELKCSKQGASCYCCHPEQLVPPITSVDGPPKLKSWINASCPINTGAGMKVDVNCSLRIIGQWVRAVCKGPYTRLSSMTGLGTRGVDYFQKIEPGAVKIALRMKRGVNQQVKVCRPGGSALLFVNWLQHEDRPREVAIGRFSKCE